MKKLLILIGIIFLAFSCAHVEKEYEKKVKIVRSVDQSRCKKLGEVRSKNVLEKTVFRELKRMAFTLKGNRVLEIKREDNWPYTQINGIVFSCPQK